MNNFQGGPTGVRNNPYANPMGNQWGQQRQDQQVGNNGGQINQNDFRSMLNPQLQDHLMAQYGTTQPLQANNKMPLNAMSGAMPMSADLPSNPGGSSGPSLFASSNPADALGTGISSEPPILPGNGGTNYPMPPSGGSGYPIVDVKSGASGPPYDPNNWNPQMPPPPAMPPVDPVTGLPNHPPPAQSGGSGFVNPTPAPPTMGPGQVPYGTGYGQGRGFGMPINPTTGLPYQQNAPPSTTGNGLDLGGNTQPGGTGGESAAMAGARGAVLGGTGPAGSGGGYLNPNSPAGYNPYNYHAFQRQHYAPLVPFAPPTSPGAPNSPGFRAYTVSNTHLANKAH